jgi:hypothetical protein
VPAPAAGPASGPAPAEAATATSETAKPHIALILPEGGRFAPAAEAIRAGFNAAWERDANNPERLVYRVYSTTDEKDLQSLYDRIVAEGAQFIVGPLQKELVETLAKNPSLPVPTLALNHIEAPQSPTNLLQFGLPPEQEARQLAERAWLDGRTKALVLVPTGPFGERMFIAFKSRWLELGGGIMRRENYGERGTDAVRKIFSLPEDENDPEGLPAKAAAPEGDFIFLVAIPPQARQIQPLIRQSAPNLPVYATSQSFSGIVNAAEDSQEDGLTFPDMPWTLQPRDPPLRDELQNTWRERGAPFVRLYGLGVDAYRILPQLARLRADPFARYQGETGILHIDERGRLFRELLWARFMGGIPQLIEAAASRRE